jgi:uncharacterized protein (TIGR02246 family)
VALEFGAEKREMKVPLLLLTTLLAASSATAAPRRAAGGEDARIRRMAVRFAEAWNKHDMTEMASLFAGNADFVNVGGMHWKGREQIRNEHRRVHEMQMKDSTLTIRAVSVRFLKPDVGLAHIEWELQGDRDPDGTSRPPREGVMSWVVQKHGQNWLVASSQNTNIRVAGAPR